MMICKLSQLRLSPQILFAEAELLELRFYYLQLFLVLFTENILVSSCKCVPNLLLSIYPCRDLIRLENKIGKKVGVRAQCSLASRRPNCRQITLYGRHTLFKSERVITVFPYVILLRALPCQSNSAYCWLHIHVSPGCLTMPNCPGRKS
jgi:hypothetical protein